MGKLPHDEGLRWTFRYLTSYVYKTHYPLLALYIPTGLACLAGVIVGFRSLLAPDVGILKGKSAWDDIRPSHQFQIFCPSDFNYKDLPDVPKYEDK